MSAAPAYSHYTPTASHVQAQPARHARSAAPAVPDIGVIPGSAQRTKSAADAALFFAKITAVIMVAIAIVCCVRVTLSSMAASTAMEAREISSQIDELRSSGSKLEVSLSSLSNPSFVKQEAAALGMSAPASDDVLRIDLSDDVVVTDAAGTLLLSGSAERIAQG